MLLKKRYARLSERYPFTTAGLTSSVVFLCSDCFAQCVLTSDAVDHGFDYRRCGGLVMFGLVYYGGPLKAMYLLFDKVRGKSGGWIRVPGVIHIFFGGVLGRGIATDELVT